MFEDLKAASECGKIVAAVLISPVRAQSAAGDESVSLLVEWCGAGHLVKAGTKIISSRVYLGGCSWSSWQYNSHQCWCRTGISISAPIHTHPGEVESVVRCVAGWSSAVAGTRM